MFEISCAKYSAGLYEKLSSSLLCLSLDYEDLSIIKWIIRIFSSVLICFNCSTKFEMIEIDDGWSVKEFQQQIGLD